MVWYGNILPRLSWWYALQATGNLSSPSGPSQLEEPQRMLNGNQEENGFYAKLTNVSQLTN